MKAEITDHALVRWLERVHEQDMEAFRAELAAIVQPYVDIRVSAVEIGGWWFLFDGNKLVTVTPRRPDPRSRIRHDRGESFRPDKDTWQAAKRRRNHR